MKKDRQYQILAVLYLIAGDVTKNPILSLCLYGIGGAYVFKAVYHSYKKSHAA